MKKQILGFILDLLGAVSFFGTFLALALLV